MKHSNNNYSIKRLGKPLIIKQNELVTSPTYAVSSSVINPSLLTQTRVNVQ